MSRRFTATVEKPPATEEFAIDMEAKEIAGYWRLAYTSTPMPANSPHDFVNPEEMLRDLLKRNGYLVRRVEELRSA